MSRWAAALAVAALVTPAWVGAPPAGAAPTALCSPGGSGGKQVAIVIDDGRSSVDARCIEINDSVKNGAQFLALRAELLDTQPPTYDRSGLLCSIDGYPKSGCGEQTGDSYAYWSYWDGRSGSWVFANIGPASRRMTNASVEGWRFQTEGTLGSSGQPPDYAADRERICPTPPPDDPPPDPNTPPPDPNTPPPEPNTPPPDPGNPPPEPNTPPPEPNTPPPDPNTPPANPPPGQANPPTAQTPAPHKPTPKRDAPLATPPQESVPPKPTAKRRPSAPTTAPTAPAPTTTPRKGAPTAVPPKAAPRDGAATRQSAPTTLPASSERAGAPDRPAATIDRAPETIAGVSPSSPRSSDKTTNDPDKPQGGPTTLAEGDEGDPPGRVTNVAQAGDLAVPGSKQSSNAGLWGLGIGVGAIGASGVSARWLRRRRLS